MTWTRSPRPTREQRIAERAERMAAQAQTCMPRRAAVMGGATSGPAPEARQKVPGKVRQSIRDSARELEEASGHPLPNPPPIEHARNTQ